MNFARYVTLVLLCPLALLAQPRQAVPDVVLEDFSDMVTVQDSGFTDFSGNMGAVSKDNRPYGTVRFGRASGRPAMTLRWDYSGQSDTVSVDGFSIGSLQPPDTGDFGFGWDVFVDSTLTEAVDLLAGSHVLKFDVTGGDEHGVELDRVRLEPVAESGPRAWVNRARFAIGEGPAALHLENARSGMVWTLIGGNPNIRWAAARLLPLKTVSAASGVPGAAPESLLSSFGVRLPRKDVGIRVLGSTGRLLDGQPVFNAATQANWVAPAATAGEATVTVRGSDASAATGTLVFSRLAPALFSANASGQGVAAANLIRVKSGVQTIEAVAEYDAASGRMVPVPIHLGGEDERLYLVLYGTGLRGNAGLDGVALRVGGEVVPVGYCGAQPAFLGLDQVNAGSLPRSLAGRGALEVNLAVEGQRANTVMLSFQ